jgi:hypothetical protein
LDDQKDPKDETNLLTNLLTLFLFSLENVWHLASGAGKNEMKNGKLDLGATLTDLVPNATVV